MYRYYNEKGFHARIETNHRLTKVAGNYVQFICRVQYQMDAVAGDTLVTQPP